MADTRSLSFAFLEAHPADAARVLETLLPTAAAALLAAAPLRLSAPVARQMLPLFSARVMDALEDQDAVALLRAMGPQAGVAALRQMPTARADHLLNLLPATLTVAFRLLLGYPENTVGAWTDPQILALTPELCASDAIERLRDSEHDHEALYVVGNQQRLLGMIPIVDLLRAAERTPLRQLLQPVAVTLPAQSLISAMRNHSAWSAQRALPVVERGERFAGVLWHATLDLALTPTTVQWETSKPADALSLLAGGYWFTVAGLIELMVSWLPAGGGNVNRSAHER